MGNFNMERKNKHISSMLISTGYVENGRIYMSPMHEIGEDWRYAVNQIRQDSLAAKALTITEVVEILGSI